MANKYNYGPAYADVYYCLTDYHHKTDNGELDDLDDKTRSLALKYLTDGAELGNEDCRYMLGQQYILGKHVARDTIKGNELMKLSE